MKEYIEINKETFPTPFRKVLTDFMKGWNTCLNSVLQHKVTDVTPVVHGRWYDEDSCDAHGSPIYRCSVCNKTVADNYISCHKYCLHCGTDMRGVVKND